MYSDRQMAYRDTEVLSSSPERLIPLMYEKLLVCLKRGAAAIRNGDMEAKFENLDKSQDLVYELLGSLDFEQGGEIASRLSSLYAFWAREISESGRTLDEQRVIRVAGMVAELHESWLEAVRAVESGEPAVAS